MQRLCVRYLIGIKSVNSNILHGLSNKVMPNLLGDLIYLAFII